VLAAAAAAHLDLRLTRAAEGWLEKAEREGRADENYSAMLVTILGQGRNGESR
jgi:hypothetical protein